MNKIKKHVTTLILVIVTVILTLLILSNVSKGGLGISAINQETITCTSDLAWFISNNAEKYINTPVEDIFSLNLRKTWFGSGYYYGIVDNANVLGETAIHYPSTYCIYHDAGSFDWYFAKAINVIDMDSTGKITVYKYTGNTDSTSVTMDSKTIDFSSNEVAKSNIATFTSLLYKAISEGEYNSVSGTTLKKAVNQMWAHYGETDSIRVYCGETGLLDSGFRHFTEIPDQKYVEEVMQCIEDAKTMAKSMGAEGNPELTKNDTNPTVVYQDGKAYIGPLKVTHAGGATSLTVNGQEANWVTKSTEQSEVNTFFIGDSWTAGLQSYLSTTSEFPGHDHFLAQAGLGAQASLYSNSNLKSKIDAVKDDISSIAIMLGLNDTSTAASNRMKEIIDFLSSTYSDKTLYVLKVPHVGEDYYYSANFQADQLNAKVDDYNNILSSYCAGKANVQFIDTVSGLMDNKSYLNPDYIKSDNLHLNNTGYGVWYNSIKSYVGSIVFNSEQSGKELTSGQVFYAVVDESVAPSGSTITVTAKLDYVDGGAKARLVLLGNGNSGGQELINFAGIMGGDGQLKVEWQVTSNETTPTPPPPPPPPPVTEPEEPYMKIIKKDANGNPVEGVHFEIGDTTYATNKDGVAYVPFGSCPSSVTITEVYNGYYGYKNVSIGSVKVDYKNDASGFEARSDECKDYYEKNNNSYWGSVKISSENYTGTNSVSLDITLPKCGGYDHYYYKNHSCIKCTCDECTCSKEVKCTNKCPDDCERS